MKSRDLNLEMLEKGPVEYSKFTYVKSIPKDNIIAEVYDLPTHDRGKRGNISYDCTQAVDLKCDIGTPANPMRKGKVTYIQRMKEKKTWRSLDKPPEGFFEHPLDVYGNFVVIAHEDGPKGERSLYGHMNRILVKEGDVVSEGDIIGYTGETGQSLKPHIHNEVGYWKDKNTWITRKVRWAGAD